MVNRDSFIVNLMVFIIKFIVVLLLWLYMKELHLIIYIIVGLYAFVQPPKTFLKSGIIQIVIEPIIILSLCFISINFISLLNNQIKVNKGNGISERVNKIIDSSQDMINLPSNCYLNPNVKLHKNVRPDSVLIDYNERKLYVLECGYSIKDYSIKKGYTCSTNNVLLSRDLHDGGQILFYEGRDLAVDKEVSIIEIKLKNGKKYCVDTNIWLNKSLIGN